MVEREMRASLEQEGLLTMGVRASFAITRDPKHLVFAMARYKFVAKMFDGYESVLEVGCGDAFASVVVAQSVKKLVCSDSEPYFVLEQPAKSPWLDRNMTLELHDMVKGPATQRFQGIYSLDVLEHIQPDQEARFMDNIVASTAERGVLIIGTPNITSSPWASPQSELEHINLKSHASLKETLSRYYRDVLIFGMNDETLHTGFPGMCHYLFGLAIEPR